MKSVAARLVTLDKMLDSARSAIIELRSLNGARNPVASLMEITDLGWALHRACEQHSVLQEHFGQQERKQRGSRVEQMRRAKKGAK